MWLAEKTSTCLQRVAPHDATPRLGTNTQGRLVHFEERVLPCDAAMKPCSQGGNAPHQHEFSLAFIWPA